MFAKQTLNFACEVSSPTVQENNANRTEQRPARRTFNVGRLAAMCGITLCSPWTVGDACPYSLMSYLAALCGKTVNNFADYSSTASGSPSLTREGFLLLTVR